ncbi:hypothetical protein ACIBCM_21815 [Streptomyces sp. NPDC051018]|uniref:hypothetical protein n=1 Tax=Streptomyces sp. NPDC051018 TaxID=3365639 RepID=UPI0037BB0CEF
MERFEGGQKNRAIAAMLRVSERSVERWRRRQWRERGGGPVEGIAGAAEALRRAGREAGAGAGTRSAGPRLGRSAVDPCTDQDADRSAVPRELHGGGHVAAAEAARLVLAAGRPAGDRA